MGLLAKVDAENEIEHLFFKRNPPSWWCFLMRKSFNIFLMKMRTNKHVLWIQSACLDSVFSVWWVSMGEMNLTFQLLF